LASKTPASLNLVEMETYEESIIIVPISGAESKVIFITEFNYGGKLPGFLKHKISIERLKYLKCIKSYFYDQNQQKVYETFKKGTQIVEYIKKSMKDIGSPGKFWKIKHIL
jgi:hypothetical protein